MSGPKSTTLGNAVALADKSGVNPPCLNREETMPAVQWGKLSLLTQGPSNMKAHPELQYLNLLRKILEEGVERPDRTGTGTKSIFGCQLRFDLADGFPLLTTKKIFFKGIVHELLWFLSGDTNVRYLQEHGIKIWDAWAKENGDLGPVYGHQWRHWPDYKGGEIDQIDKVVRSIQLEPNSRRHIVSAWNVAQLGQMALAPCHTLFQFYVANGLLSCHLYQRSADCPIGQPFNIAQYALLTHMVAQQCSLFPGELIWTGGDVHVYLNQVDGVRKQLARQPLPLPTLLINRRPSSIFDYHYDDFSLLGYDPHPHIPMPVAV